MGAEIDSFIRTLGPWGYPLFVLAALTEYVFPPFPGDTVVVLGGAWAARGDRSPALLGVMLTAGNMLGIALTWRLGKAMAGRIERASAGERVFLLKVETIRKAQAAMKQRGGLLLVTNRFLPSFRSVLFIAAGASEVPLGKAMALGTLSALVFNALLVGVGVSLGDNAEAIAQFFSRFRWVSLGVLGVVVLIVAVRFIWQKARAQSAA